MPGKLAAVVGATLIHAACASTATSDLRRVSAGDLEKQPSMKTCRKLPPPADPKDLCTVTAGHANLLIRGNILLPWQILKGGDVLVSARDGSIRCVHCDCSGHPDARGATEITCAQGLVSPGLVNSHDHLGYDHNFPARLGDRRFDHRNEWRAGSAFPQSLNLDPRVQAWSELRQIISGTTTIVSKYGVAGLARTLGGKPELAEGLTLPGRVDVATFPLGDATDMESRVDDCDYPGIVQPDEWNDGRLFVPHVAEGVDRAARNEFLCLSGQRRPGGVDATGARSTFVHAVALLNEDAEILERRNVSIVWSPRSNISLYGNTAPVVLYDKKRINIALGTDWTPSGSLNLLRELKCADELSVRYYDGYFSPFDLWKMATVNAAFATHTWPQIGVLWPGSVADVAVFNGKGASGNDSFRSIVQAGPADVALVLRGGVPLYGDASILEKLAHAECEPLTGPPCVAGKSVCVRHGTSGDYGYQDLVEANAGLYGLVFCGVPDDEPTCVPKRVAPIASTGSCGVYPVPGLTDRDGDGVEDAADNCPNVFNPVRPLDYAVRGACRQADIDPSQQADCFIRRAR